MKKLAALSLTALLTLFNCAKKETTPQYVNIYHFHSLEEDAVLTEGEDKRFLYVKTILGLEYQGTDAKGNDSLLDKVTIKWEGLDTIYHRVLGEGEKPPCDGMFRLVQDKLDLYISLLHELERQESYRDSI